MTVGELRRQLQGLPGDMPVELEVTHDDGDKVAMSDLLLAAVEERCDGVPRLYLSGEHGEVEEPRGEPRGELRIVP